MFNSLVTQLAISTAVIPNPVPVTFHLLKQCP